MGNETITATGSSGRKYTFYLYSWGTDFKKMGGVYMILRKTDHNGNHAVLYIGQTGDLSERFDHHHKKSCFDRNRKTHIAVLVESAELNRRNIESDLIRNYIPYCNN
ncbi:GIY-YIG nuclease family protein [Thermodesulfobacteriota bacterium]